MTPYFFSDICGTLYRINTSYSFLEYYFRRNNRIKEAYFRLLLSWPAKVVWKLLGNMMGMEWLRNHLLGLLRGEEQKKVDSDARDFVHDVLPKLKNLQAFNRILPDSPLVLVSATLSPLAKAIAENLGAETYFATEIEVSNGVYTGKIQTDARRRKLEILAQSQYAPYLSNSYFMTDNKEDLPLVRTVKEAIIVTSSPAHQRFWMEQRVAGLIFLDNK